MKKTKLYHSHPPKQEDKEEGKRRKNTKPCILQLPEHIIMEIFCKTPIKALIQCRRVCKSWRCLLSDPQFTKYLFSRTPNWLLLRDMKHRENQEWSCFSLVDLENYTSNQNVAVMKLPEDPNIPTHAYVVGSCNGVLCLYCHHISNDGRFYIYNPITGESLAIPNTVGFGYSKGIGFSPISDVYKLVLIKYLKQSEGIEPFGRVCNVMVTTVGSGIWRSIGKTVYASYKLQTDQMINHNGFLHWIAYDKGSGKFLISALDLETERFQLLPLPPYLLDSGFELLTSWFNLGVLKGCLSLTIKEKDKMYVVWVMKDYGIAASWTKEVELSVGRISPTYIRVLKITEKGLVWLLHDSYELQVYTPRTRGLVRVEVDGMPYMVHKGSHTPSFVSLNNFIGG